MNKCDYCGRENEAEALQCRECGTPFPLATGASGDIPPVLEEPKGLTGGRGTALLFAFLGAQVVASGIVFSIGSSFAAASRKAPLDAARLAEIVQALMAPALLTGFVASAVVVFLLARHMIGDQLQDRSPTGAAWVLGSPKSAARALALGVLLAVVTSALGWLIDPRITKLGPLAQMYATPGYSRIIWYVLALLAPFIEEPLFRGVLYGAYRKATGPVWGATLTTSIFALLHTSETIHFWPAMVGVVALACTALWVRLRTSAIGPAIAAHLGYNAAVGAAGLIW
jgi:membrane protease YdiL (CAAX protease family)